MPISPTDRKGTQVEKGIYESLAMSVADFNAEDAIATAFGPAPEDVPSVGPPDIYKMPKGF